MSKTIDERVVSMQFDNKHFESNVQTSLSTLEKLKQSLNLTGASKGFENVNAAAQKVNMSGLSSGIETVRTKFSALEVMGVTALVNITNSAVNAGKRIVSALTIEPVKTGFNEYELKMGSVQTIMAATGESLEFVNNKLNELNEYSDKTIYSFSDMTQNIGKFTNAGVSLEDAVQAIKGISNEAAVSGANANEASRAMYNFAQALSAGYVKLIDWKSIELANMGTVEFKQQLIDTAVELGTLTKISGGYKTAADNAVTATYNFNDSLKDEWMTSEVLIETLKKYSDETTEIGKKAYASAQDVKTATQLFDTLKESAQSGWAQTWEIIVGDFNEAKSFFTTLSKVFGTIIDKISDIRNNFIGGIFKSSWEKITDKIEEAGASTEDFQKIIKKLAKKHNVNLDKMIKKEGSFEKALQKAFNNKKLDKSILSKALKELVGGMTGVTDSTEEMAEQMEKYGDIVDKVIRGDFGNGKARIEALTKAGYDYATIQNLVNEKLGISVRHTSKLTEEQLKNADSLSKLSDKQLKQKGFTDEQIKALRELADEADKAGTSISDLIDNFDKMSGRELLIDTFKNVWEAVVKIIDGIKKAWSETFTSDSTNGVYNMIETIHTLSEGLSDIEGVVDKVTRIAKGVFAFTKLFTSFGTKLALVGFDIIKGIFGLTNTGLLELAAKIGDAIVKVKDLIFNNKLLAIDLDKVADTVVKVVKAFVGWIDTFIKLPGVQKTLTSIRNAISDIVDFIGKLLSGEKSLGEAFEELGDKIAGFFNKIIDSIPFLSKTIELVKAWVDALSKVPLVQKGITALTNIFKDIADNFREAYSVGKNIVDGIIEGLKDGSMTLVQAIIEIGKMLINAICTVLGIHSPSVEFYQIGMNTTQGFVNGLQNGASKIWEAIKNIGQKCIDGLKNFFGKIDFGTVMATGFGVGVILISKKLLDLADKFAGVAEAFAAPFKGMGKALTGLGDMFKSIGKEHEAKKWKHYSAAILNFAKAIAVLAASVWLLSKIPPDALWQSIGAIAALAVIIGVLALAASKLNEVGNYGKQSVALVAIAGSMLILALALKQLSTIPIENADSVIKMLTAMILGMALMMAAIGAFVNGGVAANIDKTGVMLLKMSAAMLIMTFVIKQISKLEGGEVAKGLAVIAAIELLFAGIIFVSKFAGANAAKAGGMMLMMSGALFIMIGVIKAAASLSPEEVFKGIGVISSVMVLFAGIIAVSYFAGEHAAKAGILLLGMAAALAVIPFVIKQIAGLSAADIVKGLAVITAVGVLFSVLIAVSYLAGKNAAKAGIMLIMMSGALLILTGVMALISLLEPEDIKKSLGVITVLELLFAGLIAVTHFAKDCKATLITLTVTIGLLVVALAALTLIDPSKLKNSTLAISSVISAFALLIASTKFAGNAKSLIGTIAVMLVVVAALGGVVYGLAQLDAGSALSATLSVSILLISFAASMAIMSVVGRLGTPAIGALALMGLVVGELALILGLMSYFNVNPSIETAKALSILLMSMSGALVILGVVGLMGPAAYVGIGALATLIAAVGGILVAIGALADKFPQLESFLDNGIPILEKIGKALGSFFGNIVGGFLEGVTDGLPGIGLNLGLFMTNAQPFIIGAKMVDDKVITGVETLAKAVLALTAADLITGAASLLNGGSSLAQLGLELSTFMANALPFIAGAATISPDMMAGVKALADTILVLTAADLLEGLTSWLGGSTSSLSAFGAELAAFGPSMKTYSDSVTGIDVEAVKVSAEAAKNLAEMAKAMPAEGGLISKIFGDSNMQTFGTQLVAFGTALCDYSAAVSAKGAINSSAITTSVNAAKKLVELQSSLEPMDGLLQFFTGTSSLSTFAENITAFGTAIVSYSTAVAAENAVDAGAISKSVKAAKKLAGLQESLEPIGGVISWFKGKSDLGTFGEKLAEFGGCLAEYSTSISGISMDSLSTSTAEFQKIADMAKGLAGVDFSGMESFGDSLGTIGADGVNKFIAAFKNANESISEAGGALLKKLVEGAKGQTESMKTSFKSLVTSAVSAIKSKYQSFYGAGEYLGDGLVAGIASKETDAYNAGYALGQAAVRGEKDGQKSNSPSKLTIKAGKWIGEGLIIGIQNMASKVYNSGHELGNSAVSSVSSAIARISDVVNSDVDVQPTIRPVLDLSDVKSGAGAIGGLLNANGSVGVSANIGAISTMMNRRNQNGANGDVIAALKDLKKTIGSSVGNSYNINGISYSEGDDVSEALKTIVRAVRLDGRA